MNHIFEKQNDLASGGKAYKRSRSVMVKADKRPPLQLIFNAKDKDQPKKIADAYTKHSRLSRMHTITDAQLKRGRSA